MKSKTKNDDFDATDATLRPLSSYCRRLPADAQGRRTSPATLWRWRVRPPFGIRFPAVAIGCRWYANDRDVAAWMRAVAAARTERSRATVSPSHTARSTGDDDAVAELRHAGIVPAEEADR